MTATKILKEVTFWSIVAFAPGGGLLLIARYGARLQKLRNERKKV